MNHASSKIPAWYFDIFNHYKTTLQSKNALYLALSAGVDSNTLLHWLAVFKNQLPPIYTIHVNHNWHGDYSHLWANFARKRAEYYGFQHYHYEVYFEDHDPKGLEAAGRNARYLKFGETMQENSLLCVGHHRSDQAETLMQRLLRSSGIRGLGAMRDFNQVQFGEYSIDLFRPFLSISKKTLYETATKLELPWLEDYTNHEADDMERNIIRNNLFNIMEKEFPKYEAAFYQVTQFMQEADDLLLEIAEQDLQLVGRETSFTQMPAINTQKDHTSNSNTVTLALHLPSLLTLSKNRQKNLLQQWIRPKNLLFSQKQILEFFRTFIEQTPSHQSCFMLEDYGIFYFQDFLYLRKPANRSLKQTELFNLEFIPAENAPSQQFWDSRTFSLQTRQGGERFHPMNRDKSQTLKKLLQEKNLPQWERDHCWYLQEIESGEILWVNHLGFSKKLQPYLENSGVTPILISKK